VVGVNLRGHVDEEGAGEVHINIAEIEGADFAEGKAGGEEGATERYVGGYSERFVVAINGSGMLPKAHRSHPFAFHTYAHCQRCHIPETPKSTANGIGAMLVGA
jgi:hypothetical protein